MKYSIIVPAYNAERYIRKCLESILNQAFRDFELLIIDDGSTDNTAETCMRIISNYRNARFIKTENEGLLATRRFAIQHALGEWILFVDADDYVDSSYLETIDLYQTKHPEADLIIFSYRVVNDSGELVAEPKAVFDDGYIFDTKAGKRELFYELARSTEINTMWLKAVKSNIFDRETNYAKFGKIKGEDLIQTIPLFDRASCVIFCSQSLYNYRLSITGLGRNIKAKYVNDYILVYNELYNYLEKNYVGDIEIINQLNKQYYTHLVNLLRALPNYVDKSTYINCTRKVFNDKRVKLIIREDSVFSLQIRLQAYIEKKFPVLMIMMATIYRKVKLIVKEG